MFVFDDADMMPEELLDVLVPFLDYGPTTTTRWKNNRIIVPINKAIFIFLSNMDSTQILQKMVNFRNAGRSRHSLTLEDFKGLIATSAFGLDGGFLNSKTISASLIDYYVPFLPLEKKHVERCMNSAFTYRGVNPTKSMEEETMSVAVYAPEPHNVYSRIGCKRIEQKVINMCYEARIREL